MKSASFRMAVETYLVKLASDNEGDNNFIDLLRGVTTNKKSDPLAASQKFISSMTNEKRNIALDLILCLWILRHKNRVSADELAILFREICNNDSYYTMNNLPKRIMEMLKNTSGDKNCFEYEARIRSNIHQIRQRGFRLQA